MIALILLSFFANLHQAESLSNAGKTFVQTFNWNEPSVEPQVVHLFVLSTEADQCDVTITVDAPPLTTYIVPVNNTQAVVYTVNAPSTRGVKLSAPCDFVVYGLNFAKQSADGWMGIPVESLGTEYVVLGVEPWLDGNMEPTQLTIVAANNNTVCTSTFPNGTVHTSTLNEIGVDYITSNIDMTGTRVNCTDKVTVITGQMCSNFPKGCIACDHTVEQVPPKMTLGRNFAMVPLHHACAAAPTCCSDPKFCAKCTEIYRILAVDDNTQVSRNGSLTQESFVLQAGESRYLLLSQTEYASLSASKPVLLGQYFNGQGYEGQNQDPAFAIIPQIESYHNKYQAATCFPQFEVHWVNLVLPKNTSSQLLFNGAAFLDQNTAQPIPGTDLEAFQYQFNCTTANGQPISFTFEHAQNESFGLFAYGFSEWISYGYPGGMQLNGDPYFTCPQSQINLNSSDESVTKVCNLTDVVPDFETPTFLTDDQCCPGNSNLTFNDTILNSTSCSLTIQRTWTLVDGCGREIHASQLAHFEQKLDTYQAPDANVHFNGNCSDINSNETGRPIVQTSCNTTINVTFVDSGDNSTYVNRTWTVTQQCTNETLVFHQQITCGINTTTTPPKHPCGCPCRRHRHRRHRRHHHRCDESTEESEEKDC